MASLAEIRARLAAAENRSSTGSTGGGNRSMYPHWNIPEGTTASVRFLPDENKSNPFFWVEQLNIRLPFAGIRGDTPNQVIVTVPCVEMWNETCPILAEVRPWYKDDSLKEMANKYWKKRQYHFQGFVRENPLNEDELPENPIRKFTITAQLFNVIKAALMDPELDELPTDYERGLDFRITKTTKGQFADYNTSSWARKESALTDFERQAIAQHGLTDLSSYLPKKPSAEELNIIHAMFEASVDGRPYDPELWSAYYKPYGFRGDTTESTASPAPAPAASRSETAPWEKPEQPAAPPAAQPEPAAPAAPASSAKAEDILAAIRARQQKA